MDVFYIFVALSSIYSVAASTTAFYYSHRWVKVQDRQQRGAMECGYCNVFVGKYFIDGHGKTSCKTCHPLGYQDAVLRKTLHGNF